MEPGICLVSGLSPPIPDTSLCLNAPVTSLQNGHSILLCLFTSRSSHHQSPARHVFCFSSADSCSNPRTFWIVEPFQHLQNLPTSHFLLPSLIYPHSIPFWLKKEKREDFWFPVSWTELNWVWIFFFTLTFHGYRKIWIFGFWYIGVAYIMVVY